MNSVPSARVHAVIPAAGQGTRMGGELPKQYQRLAGRTVLALTIEALGQHPGVSGVTVVTAADDRSFAGLEYEAGVPVDRVDGGQSRAESVMNGLNHLMNTTRPEWVMVHDAARPCIDRQSLDRLLEQGLACPDGAILAMPVRDTLKRSDKDQRISETLEREMTWAAQTPQLFPLESLMFALQAALESGVSPTDEAGAMEAMGHQPLLVKGSASNIKLTWPEDLALCEAWFERKLGR